MEEKKLTEAYSLPYAIKTEWTSFLVFSILFVPFAIIGIICLLNDPDNIFKSFLSFFGWCLSWGMWVISMSWLLCFKITLEEDKIIYRTLLSWLFRKNEVRFSDIEKVEIKIGTGKERARKNAFYRLNIYDNSLHKKDPLTINMKPFSQRDLAIIADVISTKNPSARLDNKILALKKGNFNPIISEGIRKIWQLAFSLFIVFLALAIIRAIKR